LRQSNFTGEITVVSADSMLPYDRTLLSKALAVGDPSKWLMRDSAFNEEHGINYKLNSSVKSIDRERKAVVLENGSWVTYDKLLLATGGNARTTADAGIEGGNLGNIHVLRNAND